SFARDALVHLNAIGRSVAAVSERPDPPRRDGPGAGHNAPSRSSARHDQLINAAHWCSVRWRGRPRTLTRDKESPGRAGASNNRRRSPEGREGPDPLDAPILSQSTNQTRRGSPPARQSHRKRRIASIIATVLAAPKTATKIRSPRANARRKPIPASRER